MRAMFFSGEPGASIPPCATRSRRLRRQGLRLRLDGRDDAMDERRGLGRDRRHAVLAGHRLYRGLRSGDLPSRALRRERNAGLHPSRAHQAADDPAALGRPDAVGERARTRAAAPIRGCRMGINGRIDDKFTVRGENVYPSEIDAVLNQTVGYGGEHRIIITRESAMDELAVRVEAVPEIWQAGEARVGAFRADLAAALQKLLGLEGCRRNRASTFPRTHRFQGATRPR